MTITKGIEANAEACCILALPYLRVWPKSGQVGLLLLLRAAVTCFFCAHQGHCARAVQAAVMTYRAVRQAMALLVTAPLTKA